MGVECHQVTISGNLAGQFVQNVFHFRGQAPDNDLEYLRSKGVLESLDAAAGFLPTFIECCPADYRITSVRCRRTIPNSGATAIVLGAQLAEAVGQRTGEIQAAQVSPCIIWIPLGDNTHGGRTFLPGVSEDDLDAGSYSGGLVSAIATFIEAATLPITPLAGDFTGDLELTVYRRGDSEATPPIAPSQDLLPYGRLSPVVGTQRNRLRPQ